MKVICALFFVSLCVYSKAHRDPCDHLAVNLTLTEDEAQQKNRFIFKENRVNIKELKKADQQRNGEDAKNQYLYVGTYLDNVEGNKWVSRVSGLGKDFEICTVLTHGKGCGPIYYETLLFEEAPKPVNGSYEGVKLAGKVVIRTNSYALHIGTGSPIATALIARLKNEDDLIYQVEKFVAFKLTESKNAVEKITETHPLYGQLLQEIGQKFAVAYAGEGFFAHITCDEKLAWGAFSTTVVDKQEEGILGMKLDSVLYHLDKDYAEGEDNRKNEYDIKKVKPVSTTLFEEKHFNLLKAEVNKINFNEVTPLKQN